MLDGIDERREVLVLMGTAAADPRRGIEKEIELPEIADALGQAAMAVSVGVDQAWNDQAAAGVDDLGIGISYRSGRDNVGDDITFDDDVARLAARRRDRMHQSAFDHEHYAHLRQCLPPMVATPPYGGATAQQLLFLNGLIVAVAIGIHNG